MANSMTTATHPMAMITCTAATLREVLSRQKAPSFFRHEAPVVSATFGFTAVRLSIWTPHCGCP